MNLNGWASGAWGEGSWLAAAWGGEESLAVEQRRPVGGRSYHPLFRKLEDEEEQRIPFRLPPVPEKPKKTPKKTAKRKPPDFSSVKDAAYEAYIQEFRSLAAKEAARLTKRRRAEEMLLLLM